MVERADVVVLGAGVTGSSVAYQLARRGAGRVAVIDPRGPAGGMSGRSFRQIRRHHSSEVLIRLANRGFEVIQSWADEVGVGDSGYVRLGYLLLVGEEATAACKQNVALGQRCGVDTSFVTADQIAEIEPLVRLDGVAGGAYEPDGGVVDPVKMCLSWLAAGMGLGLTPMTDRAATAVEVSNGRVRGVGTNKGRIDCPIVVNAAGPWGAELLPPLGQRPPISLVQVDMATIRQQPDRPLLRTLITDSIANLVVRPDRGPVALAVAYGKELTPLSRPEQAVVAADYEGVVRAALQERVPDYRDAAWEGAVSGVYDATPDWHPIIGWDPLVEGLYLALGWSGHALKLSPAVGEAVAEEILQQTAAIDIEELRPTRFLEGRLMSLSYGPGARA